MNTPWALRLALADGAALAALRLAEGVEVAEGGRELWVRSRRLGDAGGPSARVLSALPALARYEWLPDDRLRAFAARIPCERLPVLRWEPLAGWLRVESAAAALPGWPPAPAPLRLVRGGPEQDPEMLITSLALWGDFALRAAEIRLQPLRFAVDDRRRVLVRGAPLPPLPGPRFVVQGEVAIPAGFTWEPAVSRPVLQRRLRLAPGQMAVWYEEGRFALLHTELLLPASRSSVRATLAAAGAILP